MCEAYRGPFHKEWIDRKITPPMLENVITVEAAIIDIKSQLGNLEQSSIRSQFPTGEEINGVTSPLKETITIVDFSAEHTSPQSKSGKTTSF